MLKNLRYGKLTELECGYMSKHIKSVSNLPSDFKIIHVMADGTEIDSVKGMVIPFSTKNQQIYKLIAKYA